MIMTMQLTVMMLIVIAANVLGAAMAAPQARKLSRTRRVDGVSVTWAAVSAVVNAWWAVYALGVGDLSILPVSLLAAAAYIVIAVGICRFSSAPTGPVLAPALITAGAVTTVPMLAWAVGGWTVAGIALGALYGVQLSPAVASVYRSADVSGVSLATWVLAAAEAALWGVYGAATLDIGLLTLAGTGVFMSCLVLVRLFIRRPRRSSLDQPVGVLGFASA